MGKSIGLMVYWFNGLLVKWFTGFPSGENHCLNGLLVYWFNGLLL